MERGAKVEVGNRLKQLQAAGQAVWIDYIRRSFVAGGHLARLVHDDGVTGVTVNPTILEKAIAGSADYDDALRAAFAAPDAEPLAVYEQLAVEDVRTAADALHPVYERTGGADGYVSLEVSPRLARDAAGTVAEARRLWRAVDRPNLMIKVPATPEGLPAIEALTAEGINVNVTLMFSPAHYEAVARAFLRGLERCAEPARIASVASFFVSRVDAAVDRALEAIGTPEALALRGTAAVANAKMAYRHFEEVFYGETFAALRRRGARVQRPLWASTGAKNPAYSDVLYVEELVGRDTVNTMPPATLDAFRDHGHVRGETVREDVDGAAARLGRLRGLGVDLDAVTERLQVEGVDAFAASLEQILGALRERRALLWRGITDRQRLSLGGVQAGVDERLRAWHEAGFIRRLWAKDHTLWFSRPGPELSNRLGWLTLPEVMRERVDELTEFAGEVRRDGIRHVVLLGMGGSSLAPEVFQQTFGNAAGCPRLIVLDSTHPAAVRSVEAAVDLRTTLFLVSSKSGTTTEMLSLFRYFWERMKRIEPAPGRRFVAITDPGTPLMRLAGERSFRRAFPAPADVGGRYSALTVFGLVPAALIGVDVARLLERAWVMQESSAFCVPASYSLPLALGAALGELAALGRDKVTFLASRSLEALPSWIEQLIAESTGKDGKGIIPVVDEGLAGSDAYAADRFFVFLLLEEDDHRDLDAAAGALESAGHPVARLYLTERSELGQEFFRWEAAVAAAGSALCIHPFNQPDVQLAKDLAARAMQRGDGAPRHEDAGEVAASGRDLEARLRAWTAGIQAGDYVGLQAYLAPSNATGRLLAELRRRLRDRLRVATTLGYGPRFLHSTGQLHKGGPNTGAFLQVVDEPAGDLPVPETGYTFGALIRAQALGDLQALRQRGRRVLRVNLGRDVEAGLARILQTLYA